jgi:hypothetical protein
MQDSVCSVRLPCFSCANADWRHDGHTPAEVDGFGIVEPDFFPRFRVYEVRGFLWTALPVSSSFEWCCCFTSLAESSFWSSLGSDYGLVFEWVQWAGPQVEGGVRLCLRCPLAQLPASLLGYSFRRQRLRQFWYVLASSLSVDSVPFLYKYQWVWHTVIWGRLTIKVGCNVANYFKWIPIFPTFSLLWEDTSVVLRERTTICKTQSC